MTTETERNNYANVKTASTGFLNVAGIFAHVRIMANLWKAYQSDDTTEDPDYFIVLNVLILGTLAIQSLIAMILVFQFNINVKPGDLHAKMKRRKLTIANYMVLFCTVLVLVSNMTIAALYKPIRPLATSN